MQSAHGNRSRGIQARLRSFVFAVRGLGIVLRTQPNAVIHFVAVAIVCITGFIMDFTAEEWCLITFAITAVWVAECLNTAIEFLGDHVSPGYSCLIRDAKDVAAGGVLIASCGAAVIGGVIIISKLSR